MVDFTTFYFKERGQGMVKSDERRGRMEWWEDGVVESEGGGRSGE